MSNNHVLDTERDAAITSAAVLDRPYAPPLLASFDLDSLDMTSASALTPNGRLDQPE